MLVNVNLAFMAKVCMEPSRLSRASLVDVATTRVMALLLAPPSTA
jgi:hypothetical protein